MSLIFPSKWHYTECFKHLIDHPRYLVSWHKWSVHVNISAQSAYWIVEFQTPEAK